MENITTEFKNDFLSDADMASLTGGEKCAGKAVQNTLLCLCAIGSIFNPGVGLAGAAYYAYCHND